MTEPQTVDAEPVGEPAETPSTIASTTEVDGRVWTVVELEDRESWEVYAGSTEDPARRLAQVAVTDEGYFSTDTAGVVRGPYVTLSEAAYPIGVGDPLLLGDVVDRPSSPPPAAGVPTAGTRPTAAARQPVGRAWVREGALVLATAGVVLLAQRLVRARRGAPRPVARSTRSGRG